MIWIWDFQELEVLQFYTRQIKPEYTKGKGRTRTFDKAPITVMGYESILEATITTKIV